MYKVVYSKNQAFVKLFDTEVKVEAFAKTFQNAGYEVAIYHAYPDRTVRIG